MGMWPIKAKTDTVTGACTTGAGTTGAGAGAGAGAVAGTGTRNDAQLWC